jgi:hypothetical protein
LGNANKCRAKCAQNDLQHRQTKLTYKLTNEGRDEQPAVRPAM